LWFRALLLWQIQGGLSIVSNGKKQVIFLVISVAETEKQETACAGNPTRRQAVSCSEKKRKVW